MKNQLKIVGKQKELTTPQERYALAARQYWAALAMSPYPRPRGFVYKARTWEEYHRWRASQDNPWLW